MGREVYAKVPGYEPVLYCFGDDDGNHVVSRPSDMGDDDVEEFTAQIEEAAFRLNLDVGGDLLGWVVEGLEGCASDDPLDPEEWARCLHDHRADLKYGAYRRAAAEFITD